MTRVGLVTDWLRALYAPRGMSLSGMPHWPQSFLPHVYIDPSAVRAAKCQSPATIRMTCRSSTPVSGCGRRVEPMPGVKCSQRPWKTADVGFVGVEVA